jgi:hypothetical protein
MARLYDWYQDRTEVAETKSGRSNGLISFSLTIAAAVVVLTVVATPYISSNVQVMTASTDVFGTDRIVTGTVASEQAMKRYTIRRSILQPSAGAVCIIPEGSKNVEC